MSVIPFLWRNIKWRFHNRLTIIVTILQPMLWLVLYSAVAGESLNGIGISNYTAFILPGLVVLVSFSCCSSSGIMNYLMKRDGSFYRVLIAPVKRSSIIVGQLLEAALCTFLEVGVMFAVAVFFSVNIASGFAGIMIIILLVFLSAFFMAGLAYAISLTLPNEVIYETIMNAIVLPIFFLSTALFPAETLSGILKMAVNFPVHFTATMYHQGNVKGTDCYAKWRSSHTHERYIARRYFIPLLSNAVLNELNRWVSSQWETMPTHYPYKHRCDQQGTQIKSHTYIALRQSILKEMYIVRYADDFKIFCRSHQEAKRAYTAVSHWLQDRLKLTVSEEKSTVTKLKQRYSEFLGFKLKVKPKGKKYVVNSHRSDKAVKNAKESISKCIKAMKRPSNEREQYKEMIQYNAAVAGLHNYYRAATNVSLDLAKIAFHTKKQMHNRLEIKTSGTSAKGFIKGRTAQAKNNQ